MARRKKNLPAPSRGRNLTKKQKIALAESVCEMYATGAYAIDGCLKKNGIMSRSTWYKWVAEIEQIKQIFDAAKAEADRRYQEDIIEASRKGLLSLVSGHIETLYDEVGELVVDPKNPDGDPIFKTTAVRKRQVYVRPQQAAITFALERLDKLFPSRYYDDGTQAEKSADERQLSDWTDDEIQNEWERLQNL